MATPNIVPRADSEGGLGTASKYWASAYIDAITTTGNVAVGGNVTIANNDATLTLYAAASPFTPKIEFIRKVNIGSGISFNKKIICNK